MEYEEVKMVDLIELYPTESVFTIHPDLVKKYKKELNSDGSNTEIEVFNYDNHYYIIDGHEQLLAVAALGAKQARVLVVDYKELTYFSDEEKIETVLSNLGMHTLYDFEGICGFTYRDYPKYYKKAN